MKNSKMVTFEEYKELCDKVKKNNELYYRKTTPEITDGEYDKLYRKIEELEMSHPEWVTNDSPTQQVGNDLNEGFKKITHLVRMESIDDIFEKKEGDRYVELREFYKRINKAVVCVEPKLDGCAITLYYKNGALQYAATRGNGKIGDDITANALTIPSIPKRLRGMGNAIPEEVEIRGEVFMKQDDFFRMNKERENEGLPTLANPRNATAGSIKLLDPFEVAKRPLSFRAHGIVNCSLPIDNMSDYENYLVSWGVPYCGPIKCCCTENQIIEAIEDIQRMKKNGEIDYPIDGAVIKVYSYQRRNEMGSTARAPRWAAAFKYLPEQKETILRDIILQVGRTGVITPVAIVDPVQLSGTTVTRATLHNQDEIDRKDIRIGDTVLMEKSGEIIPAIISVNKDKRPLNSKPYSILEALGGVCPICGAKVIKEEGMVAYKCSGPFCNAKLVKNILNFCKRDALNIDSLGESIIEVLVEKKMIKSITDLFELRIEDLADLNLGTEDAPRRLGEKNAIRIVQGIINAKYLPLERWLNGFGIPYIGVVTSRKICEMVEDLDTIWDMICFKGRDFAQRKLNNIGDVAFNSFYEYISGEGGWSMLLYFRDKEINPKSETYQRLKELKNSQNECNGKTFVLTGTLTQNRKFYEELIIENGGKIGSSVSKNTHYLVAGKNCGSKLDKAKKLGIMIIDEKRLCEMINS